MNFFENLKSYEKYLEDNPFHEKLGIELIGANEEAIAKAEDRDLFKKCMDEIGLESAKSLLAHNKEEAQAALEEELLQVVNKTLENLKLAPDVRGLYITRFIIV